MAPETQFGAVIAYALSPLTIHYVLQAHDNIYIVNVTQNNTSGFSFYARNFDFNYAGFCVVFSLPNKDCTCKLKLLKCCKNSRFCKCLVLCIKKCFYTFSFHVQFFAIHAHVMPYD